MTRDQCHETFFDLNFSFVNCVKIMDVILGQSNDAGTIYSMPMRCR